MEKNEITVAPKLNTIAKAQNDFMTKVLGDLTKMKCVYTEYGQLCGLNLLGEINHLLKKENLDLYNDNVDQESIVAAIQFVMMSELNTANKEVFVSLRNDSRKGQKYKDDKGEMRQRINYVKIVECKPQYKGQMKIISKFGVKVKKVYPIWIVREGDEFTFPQFNGIKKTDPSWTMKSANGKVVRVVVPIEFKVDKGEERDIQYFIADRETVAVNIKAQINQTLIGEKDKDKSKRIIELIKDMTLDQLLACEEIKSLINSTYTGISKEEMFITKLFLNATKRVIIDYGSAYVRELSERTYDNSDVYVKQHNAREIIEEQSGIDANEIEFHEEPKKLTVDNNGVVEENNSNNDFSIDDLLKEEDRPF